MLLMCSLKLFSVYCGQENSSISPPHPPIILALPYKEDTLPPSTDTAEASSGPSVLSELTAMTTKPQTKKIQETRIKRRVTKSLSVILGSTPNWSFYF